MTFRLLLLGIALMLLPVFLLPRGVQALAESVRISGQVVAVHDGDTLTLLDRHRRQYRVRLQQIDAPERNQDYGSRSKQSLSELVFGRDVSVEVTAIDRYHRLVGTVTRGGSDVNLEQVARGMAWVYRQYGKDPRYLAAEETARRSRVGLWAKPRPIPPWEFRKEERGEGHWSDPRQWFRGR